jgi:hypothetical protein
VIRDCNDSENVSLDWWTMRMMMCRWLFGIDIDLKDDEHRKGETDPDVIITSSL